MKRWAVCVLWSLGVCLARGEPMSLEAEKYVSKGAEVFRDERASDERAAGAVLDAEKATTTVLQAGVDLAAGDYTASFWIEVVPVDVLHHLGVTLRAGESAVTLNAAQFDSQPGYQPYAIRFFHPGGKAVFQLHASGGTGFDGMRASLSDGEKADIKGIPTEMDALVGKPGESAGAGDEEDAISLLDGERSVTQLSAFDHRLLCDRLEIRSLAPAPVMVLKVEVDKVHYLPGEKVKARVTVKGGAEAGDHTLLAEDIVEIDEAREVFRQPVTLGPDPKIVDFEYEAGTREFGHELRCSLLKGSDRRHSGAEFYGLSRNVYRVGITGGGVGQNVQNLTEAQAAKAMQANKAAYANYFERFAWAPCDYSDLAPKTELFWSGQTQYPGSISGFKTLLAEAHKVGVKGITYGKSCGASLSGFNTFQRHPEFFGHGPRGPSCEAMNTFFLERMVANDFSLESPEKGGWQHWASLWCDWSHDATVVYGAQAIMDSIEMFGWDGIRWDGHFVGRQEPFLKLLKEKYPNFVHGYNIAFANPGSSQFLPPDTNDFFVVAKDHGLLMDESARDWSHSNFSPGHIEPFYRALCREADYEKRIGGLPLYITFDMASKQDTTWCVLFGLAAGQRYTYLTSPGDFAFGPLPKFLTRYSAFVWDDTRRVAGPDKAISVRVNGEPSDRPWWKESVWLRDMGGQGQQVLVNLVNAPGYGNFANRVQTPARVLTNVTVSVKLPAGGSLARVVHASPDLVEGHVVLKATAGAEGQTVSIPRVRTWSIVAFQLTGGPVPAFTVTTPVEDANVVLNTRADEEARKVAEQKAKAGIGPSAAPASPKTPHYADFERAANVDVEAEKTVKKPADLTLARNGILDVHHVRGAYCWLNPVEAAAALAEARRYVPSWVDLVGFKLGGNGCMDEFPDSYEALLDYDVLVLDNIQAQHLGSKRRIMVADFVRNGGGLLVFGGYWNLSLGADRNTYIEDVLPVRIAGYKQIDVKPEGMPLQEAKAGFFAGVDWSVGMQAFTVDLSPLKEGAEVLATAGGKPAIVTRPYGKGRVIAILVNPHGDYREGTKPYWESAQWVKVIAACVRHIGEGSAMKVASARKVKTGNPAKMSPDDLAVEAFDLDSKEFTAKLKEARVNMIDSETARVLLEAAVDNVDKVEDMELLGQIAEEAKPYFDPSMAPLGLKLSKSDHEFIREAGFQILGLAGDAKYRTVLEDGLRDKASAIARQALIGLGRIGDPASIAPVKSYLKQGSERLLALTVLYRLGDASALKDAMAAFEQGALRRVKLKCGRFQLIDTLWGGVSFKLTPEARRRAMNDYRKQLRLEEDAAFDVGFFNEAMRAPSEADMGTIVEFLAGTERRELLPLAYTALNRLPAGQAKAFKPVLQGAKLQDLRWYAADL